MNDATPLTLPSACAELHFFKCKQHTCTLHDPGGPEMIKLIYNDVHSCVRLLSSSGIDYSEFFNVTVGVKQGGGHFIPS